MKEYGEVLENIDLKKYNTYGIGGHAKYLVKVDTIKHLEGLLKYLKKEKMPWYILGGGSNVILPDEDFAGVIIKLDKLNKIDFNKDIIKVEAGIPLGNFVNDLLNEGYTNFSNLMGIPGTLGGAILGNAGAYNSSIFDDLISLSVMDSFGVIKKYAKEDIKYGYRYTEFKCKKNIIVAAEFKGIKGDVALAREKIAENLQKRKNTQPLEYKNAGSVFKNPVNYSAGFLIEHANLKGFTIGGAKVSMKHANFIINFDNAKSRDIIDLITVIKKTVKKDFDISLDLEQVIVKWEKLDEESKKEIK